MADYIVELPNFSELEKKIQSEVDFFKYMELLKEVKKDYLIIIVAGDTPAGPLFTPKHSAFMMNALGLRLNMAQAYRQPYIAIIDCGNVVYEETLTDLTKSLVIDGEFKGHKLFVYSGGFDCADKFGRKAMLKLDDVPFYGERGLTFFTLDTKKGIIVDSYWYDSFEGLYPGNPLWKPFKYMDKMVSIIEKNSLYPGGGNILFLYPS